MQTFIEKENKRLIKWFHTLLSDQPDSEAAKEAILSSYGVESTKELSNSQLTEACNGLHLTLNPKLQEEEKWRGRLMASIGAWLRAMGKKENSTIIKGIACRAARKESFSEIKIDQLRSLYNSFNKKKKDLLTVEQMTVDELDILTLKN